MRQLRPVSQGSSTLGRLSTLDRVSCRLRALEPSGALGCAGLNVMAGKLSAGVTEDAETLPGVPAPLLSSRLRREVGAAPATHTPRRPGSRRAGWPGADLPPAPPGQPGGATLPEPASGVSPRPALRRRRRRVPWGCPRSWQHRNPPCLPLRTGERPSCT